MIAEGKNPVTQICFWAGEPEYVEPEYRARSDFVPTIQNPLVYHLYGLEQYPESLVLSENDYLQFLVNVSQGIDWDKSIIPHYLSVALAESTLMVLGYRPNEWDLKVLFQGLINTKQTRLRRFSVITLPAPPAHYDSEQAKQVQHYLEAYAQTARFTVEWGDIDGFMQKLWQKWNEWQQQPQTN